MLRVSDFFNTYGRRVVSARNIPIDETLTVDIINTLLQDMLTIRHKLPDGHGKPTGANRFYLQHTAGHYYLKSAIMILKEINHEKNLPIKARRR